MASQQPWSGAQVRRLKANLRARRLPCALCGQPIDYSLPKDDPWSFSYDHIKSRKTHPHLIYEPSNGQAAHLDCNKRKGASDGRPALGHTTSGW